MPDLSHPYIAWLFDGSTFSITVLTCLISTVTLWIWTHWIEWALGFAMVGAVMFEMIIKH